MPGKSRVPPPCVSRCLLSGPSETSSHSLAAGVFIIMSIFTCLVFMKQHKVYSRSLLGLAAVFSVLLSLMSGYGSMFICGVPLTSMTQILPFVIFGIGLDDAYIINCSYSRTNSTKGPVDRVRDTFEDAGASRPLPQQSPLAWVDFSRIPAVFSYFYQVTFCIALP
jgi:hypothetical protein